MMFTPVFRLHSLKTQKKKAPFTPYFEDEVTNQVISDLMNIKGYTKTQATNLLYSGGLKIMTTLDSTFSRFLMKNMQIRITIRLMYSMNWITH